MPRSPWQATQACATSAPAGPGRDKLRNRSVLQATSVVGSALAALVGWRMVGDPGTMPTARQMAVHGSTPAPYPCTTGSTMKPKTTEKPRMPTMRRLAQRRQGRSRASNSAGCMTHPLPSTRCTMASGGLIQKNWAMG